MTGRSCHFSWLTGKGGHVRTVPVPDWVSKRIAERVTAAGISSGKLFRCVCRAGKTWGDFMTDRVVWHVVKDHAAKLGFPQLAPHDLCRSCARLCHVAGGELEQINFCLDMFRSRRLRNMSDASSESETQSTIASVSNPHLEIEQFAAQGRKTNFPAK